MKDYNCVITGLKVDAEFQNKIPPLTEDEFRQLEENILEDGEIYEPIMTWNGVIVDGHNRWKIIQAHPEIPYKVKEMDFADKWAAFDWMYKKQLGRRNLTDEQKTYLLGKLYEARKKTQGTNNQYVQAKSEKAQNEPFHKENKTAATIAKEQGVGIETVKRAEKFAKGVDAIREVDADVADKILAGEANISKMEVQSLAKAQPEVVKETAKSIKDGHHSRYFLPGAHSRDYSKDKEENLPKPQIPSDPDWMPEYGFDDLIEEAKGVTSNFLKQMRRLMADNKEMVSGNFAEFVKVLDEVENELEKMKEEF